MFDLNSVPNVVIKQMTHKDIDIVKNSHYKSPKYGLFNKGVQWMMLDQNTNKEIKEFYSQYDMAYGDVLLTGFGFGILASWLASKPEVKSVTVIEISQDIVDIFLMNNTLSPKINIIVADASKYETSQHYDCLFLDHYETQYEDWVLRDAKQVSSRIPNHDLFWFWSLEERIHFVRNIITNQKYIDFESHYNNFKKVLNISSLPDLDREKINTYIYTYFNKIEHLNKVLVS